MLQSAMAGPGPSTIAFRERVQTHARAQIVPGQYPPTESLSCNLSIDEVQPPLEVIFIMGVAGYLLSLFYMLPCASQYLPLPKRRRPKPPQARRVTFTPSPTPSLSYGPSESPESVATPLPSPLLDHAPVVVPTRKRGLSFGIRRRSSKEKDVVETSPRSSISFSRSVSPELEAPPQPTAEKPGKQSLKVRCSKMLHLPHHGQTQERPKTERKGSYPWRRHTVAGAHTSEDEDLQPSFGAAMSSGIMGNLNLECPSGKRGKAPKGRTNPYVFVDSETALPDYEKRRREKQRGD